MTYFKVNLTLAKIYLITTNQTTLLKLDNQLTGHNMDGGHKMPQAFD